MLILNGSSNSIKRLLEEKMIRFLLSFSAIHLYIVNNSWVTSQECAPCNMSNSSCVYNKAFFDDVIMKNKNQTKTKKMDA